jgi:hypothetical protein
VVAIEENDDFDWACDTTGSIQGESGIYRQNLTRLPAVSDGLETDDQYFEDQMSYEFNYDDGNFDGSYATANNSSGFNSPGWIELEDGNLRQVTATRLETLALALYYIIIT